MSGIEKWFEKLVEEGKIPQTPMNYDTASYKMYVAHLESENAALRERLENAVELPCVPCIKKWEGLNRERLGDIMLEWCVIYEKGGWIVVEPCSSKEAAEAKLAELKGGKQ